MKSHAAIAFLLSQTILVTVDIVDLYLEKKKNKQFSLAPYYRPLLFLSIVWIFYFAIQMAGTLLLGNLLPNETFIQTSLGLHKDLAQSLNFKMIAFFIVSFYVVSFWDYASHRWVLHKKTFWIFHEYHHLSKVIMNAIPGINARPYAVLATFLTNAGTIITLILPFMLLFTPGEKYYFISELIPWFFVVLAFVLSITHSSFLRKFPFFDKLLGFFQITGTKEHLIHHSVGGKYNYGNFSTFWDRVFKSYLDPKDVNFETLQIGLSYDQDYLGALCLGKWKMNKHNREKFRMSDTVNTKN